MSDGAQTHSVLTARAPSTVWASVLLTCLVPMNLLTIPYGLLLLRMHGGVCMVDYGVLWVELRKDYLKQTAHDPDRGFVGKTLGHVIILSQHGLSLRTKSHEMVHVEQVEASGMLGLFIGLLLFLSGSAWWMCLSTWVLTPAVSYLCASLVALLRGEDKYRGNFLEEAAYGHEHK